LKIMENAEVAPNRTRATLLVALPAMILAYLWATGA
jgi:hypothetical protein